MNRGSTSKSEHSVGRTFLLNTFSVLIILLLAEMMANTYYLVSWGTYGFPFNSIFGLDIDSAAPVSYVLPWDEEKGKLIPGVYRNSEYDSIYTINSRGFRTHEFSLDKGNKTRIICLGGSSTAGLESNDGETYPNLLEAYLDTGENQIEVLNLGIPGKPLSYVQRLLDLEAIGYSPDVVTIYSNRNAIMYDGISQSLGIIKTPLQYNIFRLHNTLLDNYMTYRFLNSSLRTINGLFGDNKIHDFYANVSERYVKTIYRDTLQHVVDMGQVHGFTTVLIKQVQNRNPPLQLHLRTLGNPKLIDLLFTDGAGVELQSEFGADVDNSFFWSLTSVILNNQMEEIAATNQDVILVDPVTEMLDRAPEEIRDLFHDGVHLTVHGNRILAAQIAAALSDLN